MGKKKHDMNPTPEFGKNPGLLEDVLVFLRRRKKWYLIPIAFVILFFGVLVALGGTAVAPFIYTLF
jgi:hypothetical protein